MPALKSASAKKSPRKTAGKKAAAGGSGQIVQRKIKRFGWVPDLPDHRDQRYYAPHEKLWPYSDANPGPFTKKPSAAAFADGRKHPAVVYQRLPQVDIQLKGCLASGYPFVFGISVYESFESSAVAKSGKVPMPKPKEKMLGGHAILAVGYDDTQRRFIIRNSWGPDWGVKGYFTLPYEYVLDSNLADDFWTIRTVQ